MKNFPFGPVKQLEQSPRIYPCFEGRNIRLTMDFLKGIFLTSCGPSLVTGNEIEDNPLEPSAKLAFSLETLLMLEGSKDRFITDIRSVSVELEPADSVGVGVKELDKSGL